MRIESLPPSPALFDSLRAVGYSLPTAIADIIDNSISASTSVVDILFDGAADEPFVSVLDNGWGMDLQEALDAMQLAGTSAKTERAATDLGRFGLGLKTASLSQCRRLTVVTKQQDKPILALRWDLLHLAESATWDLLVLEESEVSELPGFQGLLSQSSGTLVVWQDLDRLIAQQSNMSRLMDELMVEVHDHLALVFHRFLSGDGFDRVAIRINHLDIEPADPFLSKSPRTQKSPFEEIELAGARIGIQSFTLPYVAKMTATERRRATANGDLRDTQGFYVYRAGRLVIWGTWFRLMGRADMSKLTRVKVDIPNSLDHLWSLDIKKSAAVPPVVVRDRLRALAATFVQPGHRVHAYRGRTVSPTAEHVHGWDVIEDRDATRYLINREHPALQLIGGGLDPAALSALNDALTVIESTLPLQDIHNRMSVDRVDLSPPDETQLEKWRSALADLWAFSRSNESLSQFLDRLLKAEPFAALAHERASLEQRLTEPNSEGPL